MSPLRLFIEDGKFRDATGRQVVLRGINVAGDAKHPSSPNIPSHVADDFYDGDHVNFHKRPFPREDAHLHFSRLKRMGYNTIRYVFTWEAIEAAGPGQYDEEWIQHTVETLRIAKQYGFYVFMDPHQDVWSRFSGGSGAPMWTLYAAGLNPQSFAATEAAIVHNTYPDTNDFPKMIWSTNYYRLATATMFTLFFAGRDFAPKCIIDGKNIQDYLQDHFMAAVGHLAQRIHEAGDLEDDVVFGWESLNEPNRGLTGYQDLSVIPDEQKLKKGTCPTIWQALLTGSGRACEVDVYEMGGLGPVRSGRALIDPHGTQAWLPADYDDSRYGYKRDAGWRLGECLWAQHGVWDPASDTLLRRDYFARSPRTGEAIDHPCFTDTYFMEFYRRYRDVVRSHHAGAIMLLQGPTMELPPLIRGTADDEERLVYAPHFYDGITLMTKKWNRTWNVDVVGVLRGKYLHPAFAIRVGETAIRNCFREQLATMRQEGLDRMGNHPCILTEFGIPYDMDDKHAYKTGDYSSQSAAMDANHFAVEGSLMEGYALWLYMTENDHERGDQWNGEDLSIVSVDDSHLPHSQLPRPASLGRVVTTASAPGGPRRIQQLKGEAEDEGQKEVAEEGESTKAPPTARSTDSDTASAVTPSNLKQVMTQPSISSEPAGNVPELTNAPGLRAAEAYVRPAPISVAGSIVRYGFDLRRCEFALTVDGGAGLKSDMSADHPQHAEATQDADEELLGVPTTVWLPEYHFPDDSIAVEVSSGKWEVAWDEDETELAQKLRWWHGPGEHTLRVTGLVRKHNYVEGVTVDDGYYDQLATFLGSCVVM